ncbi:MAG TPA: DNA polymerase IV [Thermodesulfobacteriota bacterium]|nr:DNA polymerase IV [Thermodesulfobacteriota bacterium]
MYDMRRVLHIDMDAFFSSVEEKRHPGLAGKPVVVGGEGDPTKRGVVSTASYEARKFGIHSAMPLKTAHKLCPDAIFLPVDYEEYSRVSEEVKAILSNFSLIMEDVGIDEAFLDISSIDRPSEEIAKEIKERIKEETGLTCSIGIAPNKLLAKMASDMQKPDGLTIIVEDDIRSRIWPLSVRKLWGVGPKTEAYLKKMGIQTVGNLASISLDRLIEEFGQSYGRYLYEASRGIDESPLVTHWEPKSISRETTFQRDVDNWQVIAKTLAELTKEVVINMKEEGYQGRTITLKIRFNDFKTYTRAKTLNKHTDSEEEIRKAAFDCLGRLQLKKKVRLIGVRISHLKKVGETIES